MASSTSTLGKRGSHFVFFLVLVGHGLLLSSQVTNKQGYSVFQGILLGILSPLQRGGEATLSGIGSTWSRYMYLRTVEEENRRLREKVTRLEQTLWMERDIVASYDRLSHVLNLAERLPFESVIAEVIGLDASAWFRTVTINRGAKHGLELNAPVIGPGGLVGRIIALADSVAQVQLLSDRECSVGALLVRGRGRGIVSGVGKAELQMKYVGNLEDVAIGDLIVTSGIDGIFPKGIAIGRVASVQNGPRLFKIIAVEPAASLDRVEEVFVLEPVEDHRTFTESVE